MWNNLKNQLKDKHNEENIQLIEYSINNNITSISFKIISLHLIFENSNYLFDKYLNNWLMNEIRLNKNNAINQIDSINNLNNLNKLKILIDKCYIKIDMHNIGDDYQTLLNQLKLKMNCGNSEKFLYRYVLSISSFFLFLFFNITQNISE